MAKKLITMQLFKLTVVMSLLLFGTPIYATTLLEAARLAETNDPQFLAIRESLTISIERVEQSKAELLPQLTASASTSKNHRNYTYNNELQTSSVDSYSSKALQLNLSQTIWQHSKFIAYTQSKLTLQQAEQQLWVAQQDMLLRLSNAWFSALQARDNATWSENKVQTMQRLVEQTQRENELGISPATKLEEAHSQHEQAQAENIQAHSQLEINIAELEQIIGGKQNIALPMLADQFTLPNLPEISMERWLTQARETNPQILAAQLTVAIAEEEVRKQRATHEPAVELIASYGKTSQGAGISGGQYGFNSKLNSIGLQLSAPLYTGGGQNAKVREALAQKSKAQYELEATIRKITLQIKQAWFNHKTSSAQHLAALQNVKRSELTLKATQAEQQKGLKVTLDVLQAQLQRNLAQRDVNKAKYEMLSSYLTLKAAIGQLNNRELANLDQVLLKEKDTRDAP